MKPHFHFALASLLAAVSIFAIAADTDHDKHHPDGTIAQQAPKATPRTQPASAEKRQMQKMDRQMKTMQEMHEKMMQAKTPEERQALMEEHMEAMHKGMSMMDGMMGKAASGKESMSPQMMRKQADMMQMMTDMMKDRMGESAPGK